eukprot:jgi/Psemu1/13905/gm1.13905_g
MRLRFLLGSILFCFVKATAPEETNDLSSDQFLVQHRFLNPDLNCDNDDSFRYNEKPNKGCEWVAEKSTTVRCRKRDKTTAKKVAYYCPGVCKKKCNAGFDICDRDDATFRYLNNPVHDCVWVAAMPQMRCRLKDKTTKKKVKESCPSSSARVYIQVYLHLLIRLFLQLNFQVNHQAYPQVGTQAHTLAKILVEILLQVLRTCPLKLQQFHQGQTRAPSDTPSSSPSDKPSSSPSSSPSEFPSAVPSANPTLSTQPSALPSATPTETPQTTTVFNVAFDENTSREDFYDAYTAQVIASLLGIASTSESEGRTLQALIPDAGTDTTGKKCEKPAVVMTATPKSQRENNITTDNGVANLENEIATNAIDRRVAAQSGIACIPKSLSCTEYASIYCSKFLPLLKA